MNAVEVLTMLKSKIDAAAQINCNYAIDTSDIEAITQALNLHFVSNNEVTLDLRELERRLDEALGKETRETLTEWLKQQRQ